VRHSRGSRHSLASGHLQYRRREGLLLLGKTRGWFGKVTGSQRIERRTVLAAAVLHEIPPFSRSARARWRSAPTPHRTQAQLGHQIAAMPLHGFGAEVQRRGDLSTGLAGSHPPQDLPLPRRQRAGASRSLSGRCRSSSRTVLVTRGKGSPRPSQPCAQPGSDRCPARA